MRVKAKAKIQSFASFDMDKHCQQDYHCLNTKLNKESCEEYCKKIQAKLVENSLSTKQKIGNSDTRPK